MVVALFAKTFLIPSISAPHNQSPPIFNDTRHPVKSAPFKTATCSFYSHRENHYITEENYVITQTLTSSSHNAVVPLPTGLGLGVLKAVSQQNGLVLLL